MKTTKNIYTASGNTAEFTFTETSQEVIETLKHTAKKGMRKCGKIISEKLKENIQQISHTGNLINHVGAWAKVDYKTGKPELQIGFYGAKKVRKKHKAPSHCSPWWVEFGTKPHTIAKKKDANIYKTNVMGWAGHWYKSPVSHPGTKPHHLLRITVYDNIKEIQKQLEDTLVALNGEIKNIPNDIYDEEEIDI